MDGAPGPCSLRKVKNPTHRMRQRRDGWGTRPLLPPERQEPHPSHETETRWMGHPAFKYAFKLLLVQK